MLGATPLLATHRWHSLARIPAAEPLALRIPDQAAKLFWNTVVPIQGFTCLHVFGKHPDVMWPKQVVFSVVLRALVGAYWLAVGPLLPDLPESTLW